MIIRWLNNDYKMSVRCLDNDHKMIMRWLDDDHKLIGWDHKLIGRWSDVNCKIFVRILEDNWKMITDYHQVIIRRYFEISKMIETWSKDYFNMIARSFVNTQPGTWAHTW